MSFFHRLSRASVDKCKSTMNVQMETKTQIERAGVSHKVDGGHYGAVTDALVGGTCVESLLDTGATTNLIRSEVARSLKDKPEIRPYEGQLLTADGRGKNVEGCITTNLKLGEIDDKIEALVFPELKNQMVLGLRLTKECKCCQTFGCDKFWNGSAGGLEVPVRYAIPKLVPRKLSTVLLDPGDQKEPNGITDSQLCERQIQESLSNCGSIGKVPESWPGINENQCVRVVQEEDEKVQADWATDDENDTSGVYREVVSLEEALRRCTPTEKMETVARVNETATNTETVARVKETATNTDKDSETIWWQRTPAEIAKMQKEDEAIAQVFHLTGTSDETIDKPSLGTNLIPKEQAIQQRYFQERDGRNFLANSIWWRLAIGQLAAEKTLARIRQQFWWPTMRIDVERKTIWYLKLAHQGTKGKQKRAAGQAPFGPGIRFSTVAVDILGPVTMATSIGARHVLVKTDLFTMYGIAVPLVSTDSTDVAREIMQNWVLTFGVPNVLRTNQGKTFEGKLIQEMCRCLGIDKTQTSP